MNVNTPTLAKSPLLMAVAVVLVGVLAGSPTIADSSNRQPSELRQYLGNTCITVGTALFAAQGFLNEVEFDGKNYLQFWKAQELNQLMLALIAETARNNIPSDTTASEWLLTHREILKGCIAEVADLAKRHDIFLLLSRKPPIPPKTLGRQSWFQMGCFQVGMKLVRAPEFAAGAEFRIDNLEGQEEKFNELYQLMRIPMLFANSDEWENSGYLKVMSVCTDAMFHATESP